MTARKFRNLIGAKSPFFSEILGSKLSWYSKRSWYHDLFIHIKCLLFILMFTWKCCVFNCAAEHFPFIWFDIKTVDRLMHEASKRIWEFDKLELENLKWAMCGEEHKEICWAKFWDRRELGLIWIDLGPKNKFKGGGWAQIR